MVGAYQPSHDVVGVILAAGRGSRMHSKKPKPLHLAAGKELIRYPVDLMAEWGMQRIVVVTSPDHAEAIGDLLGDNVEIAMQPEADGTAGALATALDQLGEIPQTVVVMGGDTPLVRATSLRTLIDEHTAVAGRRMTILSAPDVFADDLGRIERASVTSDGRVGAVSAIVEAPDRTRPVHGPAEVNTGVYCFAGDWVARRIKQVTPSPSGELYLTALVAMASDAGEDVAALPIAYADEALGVNDRIQLAIVEAVLRDHLNRRWMESGVTIIDPATTYIDAEVTIGNDTVLLPNTMLRGQTAIGQECEIGPNSVVQDTHLGDRCSIVASFLEGAEIENDVTIGPFSHLRPDSVIESGVHLGNYVEVKASRVGSETAAGHFCYLGDANIGRGVNIGAGTVTCNYDGTDKHTTNIGAGAFIGSDTMLIAPVSVGEDAATGAGAVVTKDIPRGRLAVGVPAKLVPHRD